MVYTKTRTQFVSDLSCDHNWDMIEPFRKVPIAIRNTVTPSAVLLEERYLW